MTLSGARLYYDQTPLVRLSLADLDLDALQRFLAQTAQTQNLLEMAPARLLRSWRLTADDHPTLAGLVLFGRDPQQHLPFAQINAAGIPGTDIANEPIDRKDLTGRLLDVIDQAIRFLHLHLRVPHKIRGLEPEPQPELPDEVLREAIVNAVAHRDYEVLLSIPRKHDRSTYAKRTSRRQKGRTFSPPRKSD